MAEEGMEFDEDALNATLQGDEGGEEGTLDAGADEGDEGGEEGTLDAGADEGDEGGEEGAQRTTSRGQNRVQKLANERAKEREAREHAENEARLAREQAEFYRRQAEQLQQQRQAPTETEYIDPDEKWRRDSQAMLQQGLARQADLADKAEYALAAAKHPLKAKYAERVEAELQRARAAGYNPTREQIYLIELGKDTDKNHGKVTPSAAAAQRRVAAAKKQPVGGRSDVAPKRGEQSLEERLSGQIL